MVPKYLAYSIRNVVIKLHHCCFTLDIDLHTIQVTVYLFQPDATSEEKRIKHQKELAEKLNEEARERLRGLQTSGDNKKYAFCRC